MTTDEEVTPEPAQLPVAPGLIRDAALAELTRLDALVQSLTAEQWERPSAASGWRVGDVVAHLSLASQLFNRLLGAVVSGKGSGGAWKAFGRFTKNAVPAASPALNAINNAIPRLMEQTLSFEVLKGQYATGARNLREKLSQIEGQDYSRPVHYRGAAWPLSFFLCMVLNELAIHGWDIASRLDSSAHLSEDSRTALPWFYWSGTALMLHVPKPVTGTVQVSLDDLPIQLWWRLTETGATQGTGQTENPDVTISGQSGIFDLALAGRVSAEDALESTSLQAEGDRTLAKAFLGAWKII